MPSQKLGRLEVRIEATATAARGVEKLIRGAQPSLKSETRSRSATRAGKVLSVIVSDEEAALERLLFQIERIPGAAVHECTSV